jgi:aspartate kinase
MFQTLADSGVNILMISTSSIRISCVVRSDAVEQAVIALHTEFGLDQPAAAGSP